MTDQTAPDVTDKDRELAREWAESIESATNSVESTTNPWSDRALVAARVILNDLAAPPRPTLADMTPEDRRECRRMQADIESGGRAVILGPYVSGGLAVLLDQSGDVRYKAPALVTPRPDLPRMEWPGDTPNTGPKVTFSMPAPAPALPDGWRLADHYRIGRVIVTNPTPNPGGHVYFVTSDETVPRGSGWGFCTPGELTYLDEEPDHDPR